MRRLIHLITISLMVGGTATAVLFIPKLTPDLQAHQLYVLNMRAISDFPHNVTFQANAITADSATPIVRARLLLTPRPGQFEETPHEVSITPSAKLALQYVWEVEGQTIGPWQRLQYRWEVYDAHGQVYRTPPQWTEVEDTTRPWQTLSAGMVRVYWYDQPLDFGQTLLEMAQQGYARISKATGFQLAQRVHIVVFNSKADFCSFWHAGECQAWIAGTTFGLTTLQWLSDNPSFVLQQVIPHELSHVFLVQQMGSHLKDLPVWLDEGQALNNELIGIARQLARAKQLVLANQVQPLSQMTTFEAVGADMTTRMQNWYAQAASLVYYLYTYWGSDSLGKIVGQVNEGIPFETAFQSVTNLSMADFEQAWLTWLRNADLSNTFTPAPTSTLQSQPYDMNMMT